MSNEQTNDQTPHPESDPTWPAVPVTPATPHPVQPYYSPSQPGAPIRTPDFVPGQQPYPAVPGDPNPEQTPPAPVAPGEAPAPVAYPDPGGPRIMGPDGQIIPAPGGGGQAVPAQAPIPATRTPDGPLQKDRQDPNRADPSRRNKDQL